MVTHFCADALLDTEKRKKWKKLNEQTKKSKDHLSLIFHGIVGELVDKLFPFFTFVQLAEYPGFDPESPTPLPAAIQARAHLELVTDAQPDLRIKVRASKARVRFFLPVYILQRWPDS